MLLFLCLSALSATLPFAAADSFLLWPSGGPALHIASPTQGSDSSAAQVATFSDGLATQLDSTFLSVLTVLMERNVTYITQVLFDNKFATDQDQTLDTATTVLVTLPGMSPDNVAGMAPGPDVPIDSPGWPYLIRQAIVSSFPTLYNFTTLPDASDFLAALTNLPVVRNASAGYDFLSYAEFSPMVLVAAQTLKDGACLIDQESSTANISTSMVTGLKAGASYSIMGSSNNGADVILFDPGEANPVNGLIYPGAQYVVKDLVDGGCVDHISHLADFAELVVPPLP